MRCAGALGTRGLAGFRSETGVGRTGAGAADTARVRHAGAARTVLSPGCVGPARRGVRFHEPRAADARRRRFDAGFDNTFSPGGKRMGLRHRWNTNEWEQE